MRDEKREAFTLNLKKTEETRNYLFEEINHNELISEKHKKTCVTLNYVKHLLIKASAVTWRVSISALASLVGITVSITSSAVSVHQKKRKNAW